MPVFRERPYRILKPPAAPGKANIGRPPTTSSMNMNSFASSPSDDDVRVPVLETGDGSFVEAYFFNESHCFLFRRVIRGNVQLATDVIGNDHRQTHFCPAGRSHRASEVYG